MESCWARSLGGCAGGASREHVISKSQFWSDQITVSGYSWCPEPKTIGLANLVIKNLCRHHNSELSDADTEAARLFDVLVEMNRRSTALRAGGRRQPRRVFDFEAAKLERWLLKTTFNFSLQYGDERSGLFIDGAPDPALVRIAFGATEFDEPHGLYWIARTGDKVSGEDLGAMRWRSLVDPDTGRVTAAEMLFHGYWLWLSLPGGKIWSALNRGASMHYLETDCEIRCRWNKRRLRARTRLRTAGVVASK